MTDAAAPEGASSDADIKRQIEEIEYTGRKTGPVLTRTVAAIAFAWSLFQLWIASPLESSLWLVDVEKRGIHLAFALLLCFLMFPVARRFSDRRISVADLGLAAASCFCALYLFLGYDGLVSRQGVLLDIELGGLTIPFEAILGGIGILTLLEATRRSIGIPLVIVASVFLVFSVFGQDMTVVIGYVGAIFAVIGAYILVRGGSTILACCVLLLAGVIFAYAFYGFTLHDILAHKGVSLNRLIGYQWLGGEAIFGIPIDVSVSFVFLFVMFGAILENAGAGRYFLDLAFAMVGRYRGGPAKAAILASGMTGLISGSSIANVVTTGTFTIPVMKKTGMPAVKAGAIETAASTNGQLMPPIMGAAAFIIAELIGISYFDVVMHALIPAMLSYLALFYISHLEALKLGLSGMPRSDIPNFARTLIGGLHFLVPIVVLVYLLMVEQWSASSAVFYAIVWMMLIMLLVRMMPQAWTKLHLVVLSAIPVLLSTALRWGVGMDPIGATLWGLGAAVAIVIGTGIVTQMQDGTALQRWKLGLAEIAAGMIAGARNMITIGIAVAAAGIIVGSVSSTGLNNAMVGVVEAIAGNNVYILLVLTAVLCLILGMGLPTTANYLVVASLLAGVLVELGQAAGLELPLIAVHLFVFYFGLLADSTPPVCLAAFAAAAISRADPLKTGVQSFLYDIRTAVLPFIFIFNTELLLVGVTSWTHAIMVFFVSLVAILCFSSVTQNWLFVRLRWYESVALVLAMICLFRPGFVMDQVYPEFEAVNLEKFAAGEASFEEGRKVRIHITRETNYGDRVKLFVLPPPDSSKGIGPKAFGLELEPVEVKPGEEIKGFFTIADLEMQGAAEQAGADFGDYVTGIDFETVGRPAREWIYPIGLALVGIVLFLQSGRRRREASPAAA